MHGTFGIGFKNKVKNWIYGSLMAGIFNSCTVNQAVPVGEQETMIEPELESPWHGYQASASRTFDLLDTNLDLLIDWENRKITGRAILMFTPYFYPQHYLRIDARGLEPGIIKLSNPDYYFSADEIEISDEDWVLTLPRPYDRSDTLVIEITYEASPYANSAPDDRGMYFVTGMLRHENLPAQLWTWGNFRSNSRWFPTLDQSNERTTLDLEITVSDNFQSVSNGILVASASEGNGNRRDHWKMDRPIPTGQIMLAVGEFDIIEKDWKGISVRYMGESIREEGHDAVFGQTMEMMEYFSTILDYPFPWPKFDQLVVREDPFHEMPGASVCFLSDDLLVKGLESDRVYPEKQISHAVFHQWFGSLVTSESWAHWSLMESLATYAEQLWMEHSYGQEIADLHAREELNAYLTEAGTNRREVIRYFYTDPKELLDMHSSAKGARIWDMLRTYVGDEAFFAALHHFLVNHAYQSVELDDFRLSFEAVTGEDLKWFFIQWFQNAGHPQLEAWHQVVRDTLRVHVRQVQDLAYYPLYRLPMYLDVDKDGQSFRYLILVENQVHVFQLPVTSPVASLQLDGDFQLLGTIIHQKEEEELLYQYQTSPTLAARMEAIIKLAERGKYSEEVLLVLRASLSENEHPEIQKKMLSFLLSNEQVDFGVFSQQVKKLTTSGDPGVRVLAMEVLVNTTGEDLPWETYLEDPSLQVQGMALGYLLNNRNPDQWVSRYKGANSIYILLPLANYFNNRKKPGHLDWYIEVLKKVSASEIIYLLEALSGYLPNANAEEKARIIPFLYEIGRDHPDFLTRFFAVEALRSLAKEKGVNEKILEIQALERDIRLLEIYNGQ